MIRLKAYKKYFIYGGSIILAKGLEYLVLLIASGFLTRSDYGELEYSKKVVEVVAIILGLGLPTLLMTYPKSKRSKTSFLIFACIAISAATILTFTTFLAIGYENYMVTTLFYTLFFSGGILQSYLLVSYNSNITALYKVISGGLFFGAVLLGLFIFDFKDRSFLNAGYFVLPFFLIFLIFLIRKEKGSFYDHKKYFSHYKKLFLGSVSLIFINFSDMLFLYTDVFIIKMYSPYASVDIADYSFGLNIANILLIIPFSIIQPEIENIKTIINYSKKVNKKILIFLIPAFIGAVLLFMILINTYYGKFSHTIYLFFILLVAKIFQCLSPVYGTYLTIRKKFTLNLVINVGMIIFNIMISYFLYQQMQVIGVAIGSLISLAIRYGILNYAYIKLQEI